MTEICKGELWGEMSTHGRGESRQALKIQAVRSLGYVSTQQVEVEETDELEFGRASKRSGLELGPLPAGINAPHVIAHGGMQYIHIQARISGMRALAI